MYVAQHRGAQAVALKPRTVRGDLGGDIAFGMTDLVVSGAKGLALLAGDAKNGARLLALDTRDATLATVRDMRHLCTDSVQATRDLCRPACSVLAVCCGLVSLPLLYCVSASPPAPVMTHLVASHEAVVAGPVETSGQRTLRDATLTLTTQQKLTREALRAAYLKALASVDASTSTALNSLTTVDGLVGKTDTGGGVGAPNR